MSDFFSDRLVEAIQRKGSPICVGIDPMFDSLPDALFGKGKERNPGDMTGSVDAIYDFTMNVLEVVAPHVPVVKFQSAYFEKFLWEGVEIYYDLIAEAKAMGLLVIGDVKRGDIGSTSEAYAAAHLDQLPFDLDAGDTPDAITVNPFLGMDTLQPFLSVAKPTGKGLFVLVRTSNPGSAHLQDVKTHDGRTFSEMIADQLAPLAAGEGFVGLSGWSTVGAVVGATQKHTMESLRQRLPKSIFLLPGYGTQGATADMTKAAFSNGRGAIVSASRSILYAFKDPKYASAGSWQKAVEAATLAMKEDLSRL